MIPLATTASVNSAVLADAAPSRTKETSQVRSEDGSGESAEPLERGTKLYI
jgi:hypothetical protein